VIPHRRQFVLGPRAIEVDDSWTSVEVAPGLRLSHSRALPVTRDGERLVLGARFASGAGRYVQITPHEVDLDPAGTLACYYREAEGELWCGSSVALLATLPPAAAPHRVPIRHVPHQDFYPPPATAFPAVRQLLPTQRLDPTTGEVTARPRFADVREGDYEDVLGRLERRLIELVREVAQVGEPWLPLTSGYDSRLILAAAQAGEVPVRTYTNAILHAPWHVADQDVPRRLARALGLRPHVVIRPRGLDRERLTALERHTAGQWVGADSMFVAARQWDRLPAEAVVLRGGLFELGRCIYWPILRPLADPPAPEEVVDAVRTGLELDPVYRESQAHHEGLRAWAEWIVAHPEPVDWRDRFFFDVRAGGWLSANEQAIDLVEPLHVHVANDLGLLVDLLCLPQDRRAATRHHVDLIRRMAPAIADVPFNPPDTQRSRLVHRLRREVYTARHLLGPRAYARASPGRVVGRLRSGR